MAASATSSNQKSQKVEIANMIIQLVIGIATIATFYVTRRATDRTTDQLLLNDAQNRITFYTEILRKDQALMLERIQPLWDEFRKLQGRALDLASKIPSDSNQLDQFAEDAASFQDKWNKTIQSLDSEPLEKLEIIKTTVEFVKTKQYSRLANYFDRQIPADMRKQLDKFETITKKDREAVKEAFRYYNHLKSRIERLPVAEQ